MDHGRLREPVTEITDPLGGGKFKLYFFKRRNEVLDNNHSSQTFLICGLPYRGSPTV